MITTTADGTLAAYRRARANAQMLELEILQIEEQQLVPVRSLARTLAEERRLPADCLDGPPLDDAPGELLRLGAALDGLIHPQRVTRWLGLRTEACAGSTRGRLSNVAVRQQWRARWQVREVVARWWPDDGDVHLDRLEDDGGPRSHPHALAEAIVEHPGWPAVRHPTCLQVLDRVHGLPPAWRTRNPAGHALLAELLAMTRESRQDLAAGVLRQARALEGRDPVPNGYLALIEHRRRQLADVRRRIVRPRWRPGGWVADVRLQHVASAALGRPARVVTRETAEGDLEVRATARWRAPMRERFATVDSAAAITACLRDWARPAHP